MGLVTNDATIDKSFRDAFCRASVCAYRSNMGCMYPRNGKYTCVLQKMQDDAKIFTTKGDPTNGELWNGNTTV